jgi:hypothetical protein
MSEEMDHVPETQEVPQEEAVAEEEPELAPVEEPEEEPEEECAQPPCDKDKEGAACCAPCGACPGTKFCDELKKVEIFEEVKEIFMWRNLVKSLAVFVVVNVFFLLILQCGFSFVGLASWIVLFVLLAALGYDFQFVLGHFKGAEPKPVSKLAEKKIEVPEKYIDGFFQLPAALTKAAVSIVIDVVTLRCVEFSLAMVGITLFFVMLSRCMRFSTMIYIVLLISFVWPRLYHEQKENIDKLCGKVVELCKVQIQNLKEKMNKPKKE